MARAGIWLARRDISEIAKLALDPSGKSLA
jgi:hypothetical protein